MFNSLFKSPSTDQQKAYAIYENCITKARQPVFYTEMSVPDTIEGRFEMIVLHVVLAMIDLQKQGEETKDLQQDVFDVMFADMDQSLRERGVGDYSVPKKMRKMMTGFNGRAHVYKKALEEDDVKGLKEALSRNVYATLADISDTALEKLCNYVLNEYEA